MISNPKNFVIRPLESLRKTAAKRQPGYMEECLRLGVLDATGQFVTFTRKDKASIRRRFALSAPKISTQTKCC